MRTVLETTKVDTLEDLRAYLNSLDGTSDGKIADLAINAEVSLVEETMPGKSVVFRLRFDHTGAPDLLTPLKDLLLIVIETTNRGHGTAARNAAAAIAKAEGR